MNPTPLDIAFREQEAAPDHPGPRLRFHERVLDAELVLPLAGSGSGPEVFDLADGRFVLAFDRDERLADFLGAPSHFAALSGRRLAASLAGQGIGIALNLGAPSATLLPAEAVAWLAAMAAPLPEAAEARVQVVAPPARASAALIEALGAKLAAMAARIAAAHLVEAGGSRLMLALVGVPAGDRPGVAAGIAETVRFAGGDGPGLDVTFLDPAAPALASIERAGVRFELPSAERLGPGMDPARPPRLTRPLQ